MKIIDDMGDQHIKTINKNIKEFENIVLEGCTDYDEYGDTSYETFFHLLPKELVRKIHITIFMYNYFYQCYPPEHEQEKLDTVIFTNPHTSGEFYIRADIETPYWIKETPRYVDHFINIRFNDGTCGKIPVFNRNA